jgi:hypothetical protein
MGLDVPQATSSVAVPDSAGDLVMEAILETKAETILEFIHGLRGSLHVTWEEGTRAAWLHDLLKPHIAQVLVYDQANAPMVSDKLIAIVSCTRSNRIEFNLWPTY